MNISNTQRPRNDQVSIDGMSRVEQILPCRLPSNASAEFVRSSIESSRGQDFADLSQNFVRYIARSVPGPTAERVSARMVAALSNFKDQIIADLGAGQWAIGYELAAQFSARGYIGVEPFHNHTLYHHLVHIRSKVGAIPAAVVPEDMLTALQAFPSNSVSILLSGIDTDIIWKRDYSDEVAREIERVVHPEGVILEANCDHKFRPNLPFVPVDPDVFLYSKSQHKLKLG
jgi:hypothetical protein